MENKAENIGFKFEKAGNYGGHIAWNVDPKDKAGAEIMGIVGHLDTVPIGTGWTKEPLGEEADGYLYGRGTTDDKGPVVAALYAMKAIRDAGIPMRHNIHLILGLDEETSWIGMEEYLKNFPQPDFGFTPDADFPAIHGEKGILIFDLAKKIGKTNTSTNGLELRSLTGGSAANMVAESARAVVKADDEKLYDLIRGKAELAAKEAPFADTPLDIKVRKMGKSMEIKTTGVSAHGATPQAGFNAISALFGFLGELPFASEDITDFIEFFNKHIGFELDGASLGCRFEDELSGATVLNVGTAEADKGVIKVTINVRYPIHTTADEIYNGLTPVANEYDLGLVKGKYEAPIYFASDHPLIATLMDVYQEHTGDTETKPLVIGGGTYARAFDNIVAFGAHFPGDEDLMHQKDERLEIARFRQQTEIYADAILRLAAKEEI